MFLKSFGYNPNGSEFRLYKKLFVRSGLENLNDQYLDYRNRVKKVIWSNSPSKNVNKVINSTDNSMKYTKDVIAIIVIVIAGVSLFVPVINETVNEFIRFAAGIVLGYYFGTGQVREVAKKILLGKNQQI